MSYYSSTRLIHIKLCFVQSKKKSLGISVLPCKFPRAFHGWGEGTFSVIIRAAEFHPVEASEPVFLARTGERTATFHSIEGEIPVITALQEE